MKCSSDRIQGPEPSDVGHFDGKNERKVIKLQLNIGRRTYTTEAARRVNPLPRGNDVSVKESGRPKHYRATRRLRGHLL